mgnify:CR=1 FL=1
MPMGELGLASGQGGHFGMNSAFVLRPLGHGPRPLGPLGPHLILFGPIFHLVLTI